MAGRKDKNTVNYFPHYCTAGKTLYIIENKYGNNGYAVLFKTFELLGSTEHHHYDFRNIENQEFISAKTRTEIPELIKIYDTLSNLGTIHKELWSNKIIYSAKFVENIQDAYKRRNNECTTFANLCSTLKIKCKHKYDLWGQIAYINTQSKEEDSIENKIIEDKNAVLELWNTFATQNNLSKIQSLGDSRKKKLLTRQQEEFFNLNNIFAKIKTSDFLLGRSSDWKVSFDWLIENETNYIKVIEGNYENKNHSKNGTTNTGQSTQVRVPANSL